MPFHSKQPLFRTLPSVLQDYNYSVLLYTYPLKTPIFPIAVILVSSTSPIMSVVPPTGLLRKLYQDAAQNIESQPSPVWQTWLRRTFHEEIYIVTCDMPRDESLRKVDTEVHRYDKSDDTLSTVLCIELRIFSASVRQVESQALDAARRCIRANNLRSVYVMTTAGASFRC